MLTDSHAHLDFPEFEGQIDAVLERAAQAGVTRIVTIGATLESSRKALEIAEKHPQIYAAVGIHPGYAHETDPADLDGLREVAAHPKVVAIGETGLDYYRLPETGVAEIKAAQARFLTAQLELAAERGLNVCIHQRGECFEETLALMEPFGGKFRAVFHCFGGSPADARRLVALGHLISFTGIVTFKNGHLMQSCAASIPSGSYMVETDSPYLAPVPFRGKPCEPAFTRQTAEKIADLRGEPLERVAAETEAAASAFFRFAS
ncbi:MAG: TatD family hydrolase [Chthoniobacteraceae bacterium]